MVTTLPDVSDINERAQHTDLAPLTLQEAVHLLDYLAPAFLETRVLSLLEGPGSAEVDWYVARSYEAPDGSCSLQVFV